MATDKRKRLIAPPTTFKVEMTRGCNLACKFCPVHGRPDLQRQYEYMMPLLLRPILKQLRQLNPSARIELTRRGEPTLNPFILENLGLMRKLMPEAQVSMFTNGTTILKQGIGFAKDLIDAGVNILNIDCYNNTYDRFAAMAQTLRPKDDIQLKDFRKFSAYKRHPHGYDLRVINLVPDIANPAKLVKVRKIHNAAGNMDKKMMPVFGLQPLKEPLAKNCAKPFREMNVNWDGAVPICCEDWAEQCILGQLPDETAEEVWYGDKHLVVLRSLYDKDRSGRPCDKCNFSGGYYLGFLRNPYTGELGRDDDRRKG